MSGMLKIAGAINRFLPFGWRLVHPSIDETGAYFRDALDNGRRSGRVYAYLDPSAALTTLHDGHLIYVDPQDIAIAPHLIASGRWESHIERVIRSRVKPGYEVVEVGANYGYYTLIMAALVGPAGRILSFEANPALCRLLERSVAVNGYQDRVTAHCNAVGHKSGQVQFTTCRAVPGGGSLAENGRDWGDETITLNSQMVRIDDLELGSIDFLRTDAEGSEIFILDGAMQTICRSPRIELCVEWSMLMMARRGDPRPLVGTLEANGFRFRLIGAEEEPTPLSGSELLNIEHGDVLISRAL